MKSLVVGAVLATCALITPRSEACGGGQAAPPFAIPRAGSTNVSTATSIIVFSDPEPNLLELTADGHPVAVSKEQLGISVDGSLRYTKVWRIKTPNFLVPSAAHVLTALDTLDAGITGRLELTHFTTSVGYDKLPSVPAQPHSLELWRVRYPLDEIMSGNCVFAEYRSYVRIDYEPASIPNTTPGGTVYSISLAPKTGGAAQTFYFTGDDLFKGKSPEPDPHALDRWHPELDPTREYCATITAFGDGDIARLATVSEPICASVGQLSSDGSEATSGPKSGCSCTLACAPNGDSRGLGLATMVALAFARRILTRPKTKGRM